VTTKKASAIKTAPLPDECEFVHELRLSATTRDRLMLLAALLDEQTTAVAPDDEVRRAREPLSRARNEEG
jgi:hypothetical protein